MNIGFCRVHSFRSATKKKDGFGVLPCGACSFRSFCDRCDPISLGCSNGLNHRFCLGQLRLDHIRRAWESFKDLSGIFDEEQIKKNICGTPSAELLAEYIN